MLERPETPRDLSKKKVFNICRNMVNEKISELTELNTKCINIKSDINAFLPELQKVEYRGRLEDWEEKIGWLDEKIEGFSKERNYWEEVLASS